MTSVRDIAVVACHREVVGAAHHDHETRLRGRTGGIGHGVAEAVDQRFATVAPQATGNVLPNDSDVDAGDALHVAAIRAGAEAGTGAAGALGQALAGRYGTTPRRRTSTPTPGQAGEAIGKFYFSSTLKGNRRAAWILRPARSKGLSGAWRAGGSRQ